MLRFNQTKKVFPVKRIKTSYYGLVSVNSEVDGVVARSMEMRCVDTAEQMAGLLCSDFSISNLLAVGALKESPINLNGVSPLPIVDNVSSLPLPENLKIEKK